MTEDVARKAFGDTKACGYQCGLGHLVRGPIDMIILVETTAGFMVPIKKGRKA